MMVGGGRCEARGQHAGVKRLDLLSADLVESLVTEDWIDSKPKQLLVSVPRTFAGLDVGQVVIVEEGAVRDHRLRRLHIAARVGAELDLSLQRPGLLAGVGDIDVSCAANLLMAGLPRGVLVAEVERAIAWAGGADLDVEAGKFGVAKFDATLRRRADKSFGDEVLGQFENGHALGLSN